MSWNIAPECVSTVVLCIIWLYARRGALVPSLRDRLFQACLLTTFCAMTSNIFSTVLISLHNPALLPLTWAVTLLYFITTPLMGLIYFYYILSNVYGVQRMRRVGVVLVPGLVYGLLVLFTPLTGHLFTISPEGDYARGPLIAVTYLIFYLYCLVSIVFVLSKWRHLPSTLRAILLSFPLVAGLVIVVQLAVPDIILSGSAATCALLIIYLFLQNKQLSLDALTELPNRQEFLKMLDRSIRRESGAELVILVVSLKGFKLINDTHGQHGGDAMLSAVTAYLKKALALREAQLYRYSGDEFAILLDSPGHQDPEPLVAQIAQRMTRPFESPVCTCQLSCAIGVVRYPSCAQTAAGLMNGIESSVALAKTQDFSGNICYCDAALLERVHRRQQIAGILKDCLERDGFQVYYQPIWDPSEGRFVMAEALLRLNDTPLGPLSPGEFIPIAEDCGLIVNITYMVLDKVCRAIRRLLDAGVAMEGVNVNVSPVQFTQPDLLDRVTEIIRRSDIPFSKIKLEITEGTLAENPAVVAEFITRMHQSDVRISLDDFGTGYSNLTSVTDLPFDVVKLDKSLVWSAMTSERSGIIVRNLTQAFHQLGMTVLAEGVETEAQSRFVTDCGCRLIQGFLYAKPMPEEQLFALLQSGSPPSPSPDLPTCHKGGQPLV